ncbi:MAG: hypothetical protein AAGF78_08450 [Pseudomonadota bacterium]
MDDFGNYFAQRGSFVMANVDLDHTSSLAPDASFNAYQIEASSRIVQSSMFQSEVVLS